MEAEVADPDLEFELKLRLGKKGSIALAEQQRRKAEPEGADELPDSDFKVELDAVAYFYFAGGGDADEANEMEVQVDKEVEGLGARIDSGTGDEGRLFALNLGGALRYLEVLEDELVEDVRSLPVEGEIELLLDDSLRDKPSTWNY